jgi:hypothetical protein
VETDPPPGILRWLVSEFIVSEFKWSKVCPRYIGFYRDLVEAFFKTNWLAFHALVVEKAIVTQEDIDRARRIHFIKLLTNKIQRCLRSHRGREQTFRIWVDRFTRATPRPTRKSR